ncbi:MAG: four helix bundle protein [bacterium]
MRGFHDLEIYRIAFDLAVRVHKLSLDLPKYELYEQGSQVRRSSKSVKDQIAEGYGRRDYKAEFVKYLIYAQASCDECLSQIEMIVTIYLEKKGWSELLNEYDHLGKKINLFLQYVQSSWKSSK